MLALGAAAEMFGPLAHSGARLPAGVFHCDRVDCCGAPNQFVRSSRKSASSGGGLMERLLPWAVGLVLLVLPQLAFGQIYNWQTDEIIPGTEGITLAPGVD